MKIIDKIRHAESKDRVYYSFEYFPPKTEAGLHNLYARVDRMAQLHPMFVDVTWGAGGSTADATLDIARHIQNLSGLEIMMHLTCTNMSKKDLALALEKAKKCGIQNILALRGDPPRGLQKWEACDDGFSYAVDLVRFIREEHGDYFGIGVAGYPHGHEEAYDFHADLQFLKEKVEMGADFVITQLFYDADVFLRFLQRCREIGIKCPILPGIMPIHTFASFQRVTKFCPEVPQRIYEDLEPIHNDDEAVRMYGIELISSMCQKLLEGGVRGLHFYTLNLEKVVTEILRGLSLVPEQVYRALPWRQAANVKRSNEDVRPVFWAKRPKSYLARTMEWDEFPNGRWGDARSPAFGQLDDYLRHHSFAPHMESTEIWGAPPKKLEDISDVFMKFCQGELQSMPWFDAPLDAETNIIRSQLMRLNRYGLWTINSQPRVNGAPSGDPVVGWGGAGGHVFQRAYVEFFVSNEHISEIIEIFRKHSNITFHAINSKGESFSNCQTVNALTWGVFPGKEIVQPTIVDPDSFVVWKDEAFDIWTTVWGGKYEKQSEPYKLLEYIRDHFYLVNVVDNNFVDGNIWAMFEEVIQVLHQKKRPVSYSSEQLVQSNL